MHFLMGFAVYKTSQYRQNISLLVLKRYHTVTSLSSYHENVFCHLAHSFQNVVG